MTDATFEIKEKLASLEAALLEQLPTMPSLLRDLHRSLKKDPDIVTVLTEEECAILVNGLMKQTKNVIATAAIKAPRKKALGKMTLADL